MKPIFKMLLTWFLAMTTFLSLIAMMVFTIISDSFQRFINHDPRLSYVVFLITVMGLGFVYNKLLIKSMQKYNRERESEQTKRKSDIEAEQDQRN